MFIVKCGECGVLVRMTEEVEKTFCQPCYLKSDNKPAWAGAYGKARAKAANRGK